MNILFLTITRILDVEERELYQDLMRLFRNRGHNIYIVSPRERRYGESTEFSHNKWKEGIYRAYTFHKLYMEGGKPKEYRIK